MENKPDGEPIKDTTITMNNMDAMELWLFLKDALDEDRRGKDSGRGGFIPIGADFKLLRALSGLAVGLDDRKRDIVEEKKQIKLDLK